jgi:ribosomal protein S18 acetylase RimI-like enzyme
MQHSYRIPNVRASADLMFAPQGTLALLTRIEVGREHRGQGYASKLLAMVLADSDREGIDIYLSVEPDGTGLDRSALIAWYERHGFEYFKEDTMRYKPTKEK